MHSLALLLFVSAPALAQDAGFIQLEDPLDETARDHYCADVIGTVVEPGLDLQAHTCKGPTDDQVFATNAPRVGKISLEDSGLCLMAESVVAGASIVTAECRRDARQLWSSTADGRIHPADDESLCWTVSEGRGELAGEDYLKRTLTLESCTDFGARYNTWILPGTIGT